MTRPPAYQIAIVVGLIIAVVIVALIVTRKVSKSLDTFLAERGLVKLAECPAIRIDGHDLEDMRCYRAALTPSRTGVLFFAHVKRPAGYRRYIGVQLPGALDAAVLAKHAPAYSHADGGITTVAWLMNETRENAERVLAIAGDAAHP